MPKFKVVVRECTEYTYELEADDEEMAEDLAVDVFAHGNEAIHNAECTNVYEVSPECVFTEELHES
jgi:hypothetical protein